MQINGVKKTIDKFKVGKRDVDSQHVLTLGNAAKGQE